MDVQVIDKLMSDAQVETFAYNIYRDIAEYMKTNFNEFIWWNLENFSEELVLTSDGEIIKTSNQYDRCNYKGGDN